MNGIQEVRGSIPLSSTSPPSHGQGESFLPTRASFLFSGKHTMAKHKAAPGEILTVDGPWRDALLVCRKCSRKLDGGFGPDGTDTLPRAVKHALREAGRRREVRILEVGCLGVCPRNAVTVMHGADPGRMLVVPEGLAPDLLLSRLDNAAPSAGSASPRP